MDDECESQDLHSSLAGVNLSSSSLVNLLLSSLSICRSGLLVQGDEATIVWILYHQGKPNH